MDDPYACGDFGIVADIDEEAPWLGVDLLPGQHAVLHDPAPLRLFRGPQQAIGKTWAGALDLIGHTTGLHPWCPPEVLSPVPINAWVITASWKQSRVVQRKLWELIPKDLLHPDDAAKFSPLRGWGVKDPQFRIMHRSGGWSTVEIKTTRQDALDLASETLRYAWFDEPPSSQRIFSEVHKRLMKAGRYGRLLMTMTPVNAPVEWLRVECEEPHPRLNISDHHHRLEAAELIPVGLERPIVLADGRPCDAGWVEQTISETLAHEVPVVCFGEFRMSAESPVFTSYRALGEGSHRSSRAPRGACDLYIGIDHGLRIHAQVFVLVAVDWPEGKGKDPRIWIIDEHVGDGDTTDDQDAEACLAMLERHNIQWSNVTGVFGDRAHYGSNRRNSVAKKSNMRLAHAFERHPRAALHGIKRGNMHPPIRPAKRGACNAPGAVSYGCTWLHRLMLQPHRFNVHQRCEELNRSLLAYDMRPNSDESHLIDALRYSLKDIIYRGRRLPGRPAQQSAR